MGRNVVVGPALHYKAARIAPPRSGLKHAKAHNKVGSQGACHPEVPLRLGAYWNVTRGPVSRHLLACMHGGKIAVHVNVAIERTSN